MMAQRTLDHVRARRAGQLPLDVGLDVILGPIRKRARSCIDVGKLSDERMRHLDGRSKMPDQRLKECFASSAGSSLNDCPQSNDFLAARVDSLSGLWLGRLHKFWLTWHQSPSRMLT